MNATIPARLHFDAEAIRQANPITRILQKRGIELRGSDTKGRRIACPIHGGDNKQAFHILPGDEKWHCFTGGCGGGSVIDLVMRLDGVDFRTACARLGGETDIRAVSRPTTTTRPASKPAPAMQPLPELSLAKRKEIEEMADRLADNRKLIESIALSRDWEPATIYALACTRALGVLEIEPNAGIVNLAFLFPHAVKLRRLYWHPKAPGTLRWHRGDGSKWVSWHWKEWAWNAAELWREDRIRLLLRDRIVISEGEPDTISLIDCGANDYHTTVCAIPSATVSPRLKARLPDMVRGLHVRLVADNDAAGQRSAAEMQHLLAAPATTFSTVTL